MAAQPQTINSPSQFHTLLKQSTYVLADFHATWCGPCHAIAPIYKQLASQHGSADLAFTKIDVDAQQQLAREYGITAMPEPYLRYPISNAPSAELVCNLLLIQ